MRSYKVSSTFGKNIKNGAAHDIRGRGSFSGRLTAPLCVAGRF
jgi:hypothetical protein